MLTIPKERKHFLEIDFLIFEDGIHTETISKFSFSGKGSIPEMGDVLLKNADDKRLHENAINIRGEFTGRDSAEKIINFFLHELVYRGDKFIFRFKNLWEACDGCKWDLLALIEVAGDRIQIVAQTL